MELINKIDKYLNEGLNHLVAKFSKDGKTFYLWQMSAGGYDYQLTQGQNSKAVETSDKNLEQFKEKLIGLGYKEEQLTEAESINEREIYEPSLNELLDDFTLKDYRELMTYLSNKWLMDLLAPIRRFRREKGKPV